MSKRFPIVLAAAALALATAPLTAHAVGGTCDPTTRGDVYNSGALAVDNGNVTVDYRYGWDGSSTRAEGCVGPLVQGTGVQSNRWALKGVNNSGTTYYAHFLGRKGQPKTIVMAPGFSQTYTVAQLGNNGFDDNTDVEGLTINTTP